MKPTAEDLRIAEKAVESVALTGDSVKFEFAVYVRVEKAKLINAIASMRASDREKAAKIAEAHDDNHRREYMHCGLAIAEKIRRSKGETEGAAV